MSQNHLGDANGSSDCVPISLSLCKMFCSSNSLQIPQSVDIWRSSVCNSIVEGRHMYDKISVTPDEYFNFIEFCDMGHSANEHFKKYPWKSLNIEKVEYDLIVNVGDIDHAIRPYYPTFCNKICKHPNRTSRQSFENLLNNQCVSFGEQTYSQ